MKQSRWILGSLVTMLLFAACAEDTETQQDNTPSDTCQAAAAHLAACFPDQTPAESCHEPTAALIVDSACEDLSSVDGKADGGWACLWMPWLCVSTPSATTRSVSVSVLRCAGGYMGCDAVYSAPCTLVTLEDAEGNELAHAYTGTHGSVRFDEVSRDAHQVRVLDRRGETTEHLVGFISYERLPAILDVAASNDDLRLSFHLPSDSEETVKACSTVRGYLDVYDSNGARLDGQDIEWGWFVRYTDPSGESIVTRPLATHPDATQTGNWENGFHFSRVFAGEQVIEFIPMDIPSYLRRNNPDYQNLLRWYTKKNAEILSVTIDVDPDTIPETIELRHRIDL